mmetsp:Transcript_29968/g.97724  ORF Transcript_29968/g.97724 Transcript_29968/m.97724 type:complete len:209 (-) Transcript_29968:348-974(-)
MAARASPMSQPHRRPDRTAAREPARPRRRTMHARRRVTCPPPPRSACLAASTCAACRSATSPSLRRARVRRCRQPGRTRRTRACRLPLTAGWRGPTCTRSAPAGRSGLTSPLRSRSPSTRWRCTTDPSPRTTSSTASSAPASPSMPPPPSPPPRRTAPPPTSRRCPRRRRCAPRMRPPGGPRCGRCSSVRRASGTSGRCSLRQSTCRT